MLRLLYCFQVNWLQPNLSKITVVIDGNSSYTGIGKQNVVANFELYKKDNQLLYLTKEKKLLEDEFAAFKKLVDHERNHDGHVNDSHKSVVLRSLEMNLKVRALTSILFKSFNCIPFPLECNWYR